MESSGVLTKDVKVPRSQGGARGYLFFQHTFSVGSRELRGHDGRVVGAGCDSCVGAVHAGYVCAMHPCCFVRCTRISASKNQQTTAC